MVHLTFEMVDSLFDAVNIGKYFCVQKLLVFYFVSKALDDSMSRGFFEEKGDFQRSELHGFGMAADVEFRPLPRLRW